MGESKFFCVVMCCCLILTNLFPWYCYIVEKDALLAHSVPHVLVERLMHSSDAYKMNVCSCGLTHSIRGGVCNRCDRSAHSLTVPYAFKLLQQELQAMGIEVKLN